MPGTTPSQAPPVGDYATIVPPEDDLAVAQGPTAPGLEVVLPGVRVVRVLEYAETPKDRGLYLMQGPDYDLGATPGLVAGGADLF
ncbi:MAG TPA: hypothetical protein VF586_08405 [Pyrinomonadaceae bacterium]|jgi:hypothetical protein